MEIQTVFTILKGRCALAMIIGDKPLLLNIVEILKMNLIIALKWFAININFLRIFFMVATKGVHWAGPPFWLMAQHAKRSCRAGMAQHYSRLGWHNPKEQALLGLKKESTLLTHLTLLNSLFTFTFYYMSNVYNTLLSKYITTSLRGKKVIQ